MFGGGTIGILLMVFMILPIYWGALWKTPCRPLEGLVVDFDGGSLGAQVVDAVVGSVNGDSKIAWTYRPADTFQGGIGGLQERVKEHDTWVAIAITEGTSARLEASYQSPNASYDGSEALVVFAVEARNENIFRAIIRPVVDGTLSGVGRGMAVSGAARLADTSILANLMAVSPQTVVAPVGYKIHNLAPFDQPVATAATFVGMLYYLLMGFFVTMTAFMTREVTGLNKRIPVSSIVMLRLSCCAVAYFVLSLFYSLLNLAFKLDLSRKFGAGGFFVFWMINYLGMLAMCLALESMITLLGPKAIAFFLLLWIITNLSVSIFPIEVLPGIFRYGHGFPFYNIARGLRTVVFGTKNELGKVVGILVAWIVGSCLTMTLFEYLIHPGRNYIPGVEVEETEVDGHFELRGSPQEDRESQTLSLVASVAEKTGAKANVQLSEK